MDVAVIGLGLIGGSVLQALAARGHRLVGFDADPATRATARTASARVATGTRWQVVSKVQDAIARAELVVLAVPLPALPGVLRDLTGYRGLVTDVTSVKGPVLDFMTDFAYVGGHPMAGRETSGFLSSDPALFDGCAWVLCLEPGQTSMPDWLTLAELWTSVGARVVPATADDHDAAVAAVSHVPHLLAAAMAAMVAEDPFAAALAAGSFRDGTRVAATRPELTAAMCGGNAAAVRPALDAVTTVLAELRAALEDPDPVAALRPLLASASAARSAWPPVPGDQAELPIRADVLLRLGQVGGWITAVDRNRRKVLATRPVSMRSKTDRNSS